jgi:hypothetical protein
MTQAVSQIQMCQMICRDKSELSKAKSRVFGIWYLNEFQIKGTRGFLDEVSRAVVRQDAVKAPRGGGAVQDLADAQAVREVAKRRGLRQPSRPLPL